MSFEIRINGQPYTYWESALVRRSINTNAGVFRFSNSSTTPVSMNDYPVRVGDFVEILISGVRKIAGFVDNMPDSFGEVQGKQGTMHTVDVSGRDNIQDLIDSSIPDLIDSDSTESAKVIEGPISLKALCEKIITAIGAKIKVIDKVEGLEDFTDEDLQAAGSGDKCMSYLVKFARKRQVYLVPDGNGNIIIYRPDKSNKASGALLHQKNNTTNNVKSYSASRSNQNRFNKYLCRSQDNFGYSSDADIEEGTDRNGEAPDGDIRESRYLEFQAEESMTSPECEKRADEEANIRRTGSEGYIATVAGTTQSDGTVWDFGQFVQVEDDFADIHGEFLVSDVSYAQDITRGTRTTLTCVPPDAYQVTAEPTTETARSSSTGTKFSNPEPQEPGNIR